MEIRAVTEALNKIISDLLAMRRDEAAGFMVMANSDDTMFEDCIRRLKELSASRPEGGTREQRFEKALQQIANMHTVTDDKANRMTLIAARKLAENALNGIGMNVGGT